MNINKCYPERPRFLAFNNVLNKPVFCINKALFDIYMSDICDVNKTIVMNIINYIDSECHKFKDLDDKNKAQAMLESLILEIDWKKRSN